MILIRILIALVFVVLVFGFLFWFLERVDS